MPAGSVLASHWTRDGGTCSILKGSDDDSFSSSQVVATGGKSYPKLGTDGTGWDVLARLGHSLNEPYPALTPLKGSHPGGAQLAGKIFVKPACPLQQICRIIGSGTGMRRLVWRWRR